MQLYIFIIITVLLMVKPTVNALFLSNLGADNLPYGYLLVALVAVITTYIYNKLVKKYSLLKLTSISLILFSLAFLILSAVLQRSYLEDWVLYTYYLGVSLFAVVCTSQFWVLANIVFNAREAKRLFGFIGAGAIAGGVFGGYLTSLIASAFGNKTVILVAGILLLGCIPILQKIWRLRVRKLNVYVRNQRKFNESHADETSFNIVSKSKHLTYLALIVGISVIVAKLVDFQFSDFAHRAIQEPDELASFFGFWFSTFNVIALLLQLFLTNRILSRLGVASTLLILPLAIALGSLLFITFPELWVLVIIKGIDGSFKQSLNKAAIELSIMPISLNVKNQAKSFIDVAVDSVATGISGFMLIFLVRRLELSTTYITVIILLFVFIWILLIYRLREEYYNSFRANIQQTLNHGNDINIKGKSESTLASSRRILNSGDTQAILKLLQHLSNYKIKTLKSDMLELLKHPSKDIKKAVIQNLYVYEKGTASAEVQQLVDSEDDELVFAALEYLLSHTSIRENELFSKYLDHSSDYIANAALLCLAKETAQNQALSTKYGLYERIDRKVYELSQPECLARKEAYAELLITIAYSHIKKHYSFISAHLNNRNKYIVKHAIKAAGITASDEFIEPIMAFLDTDEFSKVAIKSLRNYGPKIIDTIVAYDKSEHIPDNTKQHLPKVIQSFNTQKSVRVLLSLIKSRDVIIRLETAKSLAKLKQQEKKLIFNKRILKSRIIKEAKYYKRTLVSIASLQHIINLDLVSDSESDDVAELHIARQSLIKLLEEQSDYSLNCIFEMLGLVYDQADIEMTYSGIMSDIKDARINALEFLDNMLQSHLKASVLPLLEHYVMVDDKSDSTILKIDLLNEKACLKLLMKNRGKPVKLEVLHIIRLLKDKSFVPLVASLRKHKNNDVKFFSNQTLIALKSQ